jgi:hypothetical protein
MKPNQRFAVATRNRMFAEPESYKEAMEYVYRIAKSTDNPIAVLTAVMAVVNALANYIKQIESQKGLVDQ